MAATRVLLVSPRFNPNSFWSFEGACELIGAKTLAPPLGLLTVAAMLPEDWSCRLVDSNTATLRDEDIAAADLVMTGGMLPQEPDMLAIIARCRRLGVPVCVGGPAPTSTPEHYAGADFIVVGESEGIIGDVVAAFRRGERSGTFTAPKFKTDVTTSPVPRFDLIRPSDYVWVNVQFSRGCPFTCEFCDIIELYGRAPRTKTAPQMLAEIDALYRSGHRGQIDFVDDNLIGNKKAIKQFLPHLVAWQKERGYPFMFSTEASLNLADDAELLSLMRQANFFALFTGIETPDEAALVQTSKKQNTRRSIAESVHRIYGAGMYVAAGFIVGFDAEKGSVAEAMNACIRDTSVPTATIGLLTALPNTQLSRRLLKEGRLFETFRQSMKEAGDMCTAGLNYTTLRPRREILRDYRDVVATAYGPAEYFGRVRTLGRLLRPPRFRWRTALRRNPRREIAGLFRLAWSMTVTHPELARPFWSTLWDTLRRNPTALEAVIRNAGHFVHFYPFALYVVGTVDGWIAEIDAGRWRDPPVIAAEQVAAPASVAA